MINKYKFFFYLLFLCNTLTNHKAGWQSGYAAACKAVYAGSIPASASM
tara:strand:+ start:91 stop:234 length:144 start_codon:yes stop_codon:yes gene_type:complete